MGDSVDLLLKFISKEPAGQLFLNKTIAYIPILFTSQKRKDIQEQQLTKHKTSDGTAAAACRTQLLGVTCQNLIPGVGTFFS